MTPPSPHRSLFVAFFEDFTSTAFPAVLVIGTKRSLAVYNLLTMELMWQVAGKFHSFAVANTMTLMRIGNSKVWFVKSPNELMPCNRLRLL